MQWEREESYEQMITIYVIIYIYICNKYMYNIMDAKNENEKNKSIT